MGWSINGDPYQLLLVNDGISPVFSLENQFALKEVVRQARENPIIAMATEIRRRIAAGDFIDLQALLKPWMASDGESIRFFHNRAAFVEDFRSHEAWYEDDQIIAAYTNRSVDAFNRELRRDYWRSKGVANPPTLLPGDRVRFKEAYTVRDTPIFHNNEVVTLRSAKRRYDEKLDIEIWECEAQSAMSQKFYVVDPGSLKPFNQKLQQIAAMAKKEKYPKNRELWKTFYGLKNLYADVQYTFASTVHKLQGSTYERVYVDLFTLDRVSPLAQEDIYRLVYVAVTRASLQVTIFLPLEERNAIPPASVDVESSRRELDRLLSGIEF